jgi:hypothetical protein
LWYFAELLSLSVYMTWVTLWWIQKVLAFCRSVSPVWRYGCCCIPFSIRCRFRAGETCSAFSSFCCRSIRYWWSAGKICWSSWGMFWGRASLRILSKFLVYLCPGNLGVLCFFGKGCF